MPSLRQGSVFPVLLLQTELAFAPSCNTFFDDTFHTGRNAVLPALGQLCTISQTSTAGYDFVWFLLSSGRPLRAGCVNLKLVQSAFRSGWVSSSQFIRVRICGTTWLGS